MLRRIDWLSFTVKFEMDGDSNEIIALSLALGALEELLGNTYDVLGLSSQPFWWVGGRKPYRAAFQRKDGGVSIFVNPKLPHALVEITGRACEELADDPRAAAFLDCISDRLTRLDLAVDMLTETDPREFIANREQGRFKAHSEIVEQSGTTCYVGSRSSNRYARVYRYNPPHPRAALLRCEFVVKDDDARLTAKALLKDGLDAVVATLGAQFGWMHDSWDTKGITMAELQAYRPEREKGKTLYWLEKTIAPLLLKLHQQGIINVYEWFANSIEKPLKGDQ